MYGLSLLTSRHVMCAHMCYTLHEVRGQPEKLALSFIHMGPGLYALIQVIGRVPLSTDPLALLFTPKLIHKNIEITHINRVPCTVLLHGS